MSDEILSEAELKTIEAEWDAYQIDFQFLHLFPKHHCPKCHLKRWFFVPSLAFLNYHSRTFLKPFHFVCEFCGQAYGSKFKYTKGEAKKLKQRSDTIQREEWPILKQRYEILIFNRQLILTPEFF